MMLVIEQSKYIQTKIKFKFNLIIIKFNFLIHWTLGAHISVVIFGSIIIWCDKIINGAFPCLSKIYNIFS